MEANQYDSLREALEKLKLNDASLQYEPEVSRLWASVSMRISRSSSHGNRPGAPGAGIRSGSDYHGAHVVRYEVVMQDGTTIQVETLKLPEIGKRKRFANLSSPRPSRCRRIISEP